MIAAAPIGLSVRVAGVTFVDGYPYNLLKLREPAAEAHAAGEPLAAVLIRNPANIYDPNSIEVHVPAGGGRVGSVPREDAALLAPSLDRGDRWAASVVGVAINEDWPDRPGLQIDIVKVAKPRKAR